MIKELHLNNFKKHAHRSFNFTEGLNGIFGPNYTGKTTILYGILFAMGGASHVPGSNLQRKGTAAGMAVKMVFEIGGSEYTVERKKSGAYLWQGKELVASGTSNVTAKMEELIGMPIKRFRQLKYAEQKKAHALLTLGATELHNIIEELTGIDQINSVLDKLKGMIAVLTGALGALTFTPLTPYNQELLGLLDKRDELENTALCHRDMKQEIDAQKKVVTTDLIFLNSAAKAWGDWDSERKALEKQIAQYEADYFTYRRGITEGLDIAVEQALLEEDESFLDSWANRLAGKQAHASALKREERRAIALRQELAKLGAAVKKDVDFINSFSDTLDQDLKDAEAKFEEVKAALVQSLAETQALEKLKKEATCPTCLRPYDEVEEFDNDRLEFLYVERANARSSLEAYEEEIGAIKKLIVARDTARANSQATFREVYNKQNDLTLIEQALSAEDIPDEMALSFEETELKRSRELFKARSAELQQQKALATQLARCIEKLEASRKELAELTEPPYDAQAKDIAEAREKELDQQLAEVNEALAGNDKDLAVLREKIASLESTIAQIRKANVDYDNVQVKLDTAKQLQKYLKDNRDRYVGQVWDYFMGSASQFVSNCTAGGISEINRTEQGAFAFLEDGHLMGIKDASGAQEAIMGIAVQAALAESAQCPLDILLVDEPTADMDAEHSMAVAGMLSAKSSQVIAISHREMDSSLCNNAIYLGD